MSVIDDERRFRDERAEALRDRDRQREPRGRFRRSPRELAARDAFRIGLADRAAASAPRPTPRVEPGVTSHERRAHRERELAGIRRGLLDLASETPQSFEQLFIALCEEWGDEPESTVATTLDQLVRDRALVRSDEGYELAPEDNE
jgi:hypothetical protein